MIDALRPLADHASHSALFVDFDGTLSPIVQDPDDARPLPEARDALAGLVGRLNRVGVVSGRPAGFLASVLGIDGLTYVGHYGLDRLEGGEVVTDPRVAPYLEAVARVAEAAESELPDVLVERKGTASVALHWRARPELGDGARAWAARVAGPAGLVLHPGRMVVELRPPVPVDKGTVVAGLADGMTAAAFAGDDLGDLAAFRALAELLADGRVQHVARIAVRSGEEPAALVDAADAAVDGPAALAHELRELAAAISG
jgi:trehalose 6-phosphate phosphatase